MEHPPSRLDLVRRHRHHAAGAGVAQRRQAPRLLNLHVQQARGRRVWCTKLHKNVAVGGAYKGVEPAGAGHDNEMISII